MLVLDRKVDEAVLIRILQEDFLMRIMKISPSKVRLGFEAANIGVRFIRAEMAMPEYAKEPESLKKVFTFEAETRPISGFQIPRTG